MSDWNPIKAWDLFPKVGRFSYELLRNDKTSLFSLWPKDVVDMLKFYMYWRVFGHNFNKITRTKSDAPVFNSKSTRGFCISKNNIWYVATGSHIEIMTPYTDKSLTELSNNPYIHISCSDFDNQIIDPNGWITVGFGYYGQSLGQFHTPSCIIIDYQDRIVIGDYKNKRVQVFNPDLTLAFVISNVLPTSLSLNYNGNYIITQNTRNWITIHNYQNGVCLRKLELPRNPFKICALGIQSTGIMIIGDPVSVMIFSQNGKLIRYLGDLMDPIEIFVDSIDQVLVCKHNEIYLFSASFDMLRTFGLNHCCIDHITLSPYNQLIASTGFNTEIIDNY